MGKRKRDAELSTTEAPAAKKQVTETAPSSTLSAAERRQQRSERKSKKTRPTNSKPKSSEKAVATAPEEFLPGTNVGDDSFAGGEDFVSLNGTTAIPASAAGASAETTGENLVAQANTKKKRISPRSERKQARLQKETEAAAAAKDKAPQSHPTPNDTTTTTTSKQSKIPPKDSTSTSTSAEDHKSASSKDRFIVFVGNLPYTTTTPQLTAHFRKLQPTSIRHSTDKSTKKSKGFAFLEFTDYSAMKTCLKAYHHSIFDPERTAKLPESAFDENGVEIEGAKEKPRGKGRRINVELTAGGGGKGGQRKEKIRVKNEKLFEERERRKVEETKKEKKNGKREISEANKTSIGAEAVHPSRLKRVNG